MPELVCPAGEVVHPVLSPNEDDIECRIMGNMKPAEINGEPVICCGDYFNCPVWKAHVQQRRASSAVRVERATQGQRARHVLSDRDREKVR